VPTLGAQEPAWELLISLRDPVTGYDHGAVASFSARAAGVRRVRFAPPPVGLAAYDRRSREILLDDALADEDPRALAAVLAHELRHAFEAAFSSARPQSCVDREVDAFEVSAQVWLAFWLGGELTERTSL